MTDKLTYKIRFNSIDSDDNLIMVGAAMDGIAHHVQGCVKAESQELRFGKLEFDAVLVEFVDECLSNDDRIESYSEV